MYYFLAFLISFFVAIVIAPFCLRLTKRLKFGQNILHYVESHSSKQGTPTMGGIIFIFAIIVVSLCFFNNNYSMASVALAVFFAFGVLGFLDDFIKIKFKRNLGLRPYQKIIGQVAISLIVALFVYFNPMIGSKIYLPFSNTKIDLGFLIIPYIMLVFIATTNSVNLTDGLDGLAGGVSFAYLLGFGIISYLYMQGLTAGLDNAIINEQYNLIIITCCALGAILAFLVFNSHPASIFMGDTGSLSLGALIASLACFNGLSLFIPLLGVMFVLSCVSVIMQVLYYKKTKKRIFLMAPLHHHFEKKGKHETKIVSIYIIITLIIAVACIMLTIICRWNVWKNITILYLVCRVVVGRVLSC